MKSVFNSTLRTSFVLLFITIFSHCSSQSQEEQATDVEAQSAHASFIALAKICLENQVDLSNCPNVYQPQYLPKDISCCPECCQLKSRNLSTISQTYYEMFEDPQVMVVDGNSYAIFSDPFALKKKLEYINDQTEDLTASFKQASITGLKYYSSAYVGLNYDLKREVFVNEYGQNLFTLAKVSWSSSDKLASWGNYNAKWELPLAPNVNVKEVPIQSAEAENLFALWKNGRNGSVNIVITFDLKKQGYANHSDNRVVASWTKIELFPPNQWERAIATLTPDQN